MPDYSHWNRAALIARIEALEAAPASSSATPSRPGADGDGGHSALRDSAERLRAIVETAVEGIITIDARGIVESMNSAAEKMFDYRREEVIGQNVSMLMPSPDREAHDRYINNYVRTGEAKIIGIGREVVGRRKDGSVFPMDLSVSEFALGDRRMFTGIVRDVTERRRAEQTRQHFVAIVESSDDAIISADLQGIITSWNPSAERVYGYTAGEAIGQPISLLLPEEKLDEEAIILGRVWRGEQISHYETRRRRKDGQVVDVSLSVSPLHGANGTIIGASKIARDITESKRAKEQLAELAQSLAEKNKELEAIVYVASHDLRSPLLNIQGFANELARACEIIRLRLDPQTLPLPPDPELRAALCEDLPEALEYIRAGVNKMDILLSGFVRFSRLGRAALQIERLPMDRLLAGVTKAMEFQLQQSGTSLHLEPLPDCYGDATQINQVFSNLLDNAVKYRAKDRPPIVRVTGRQEGSQAIYAVSDNGIGIASEHRGRIFEIFHRLDPANGEGEGLGLTIAQRILERQNGRLWVESRPGEGSEFFVLLPAATQPGRRKKS